VGDIDLQREISLSNTGFVNPLHGRPRVRRLYSAKIDGLKADVTVAIYQGEGAEEVCYSMSLAVISD
jgi:hypothetical protein